TAHKRVVTCTALQGVVAIVAGQAVIASTAGNCHSRCSCGRTLSNGHTAIRASGSDARQVDGGYTATAHVGDRTCSRLSTRNGESLQASDVSQIKSLSTDVGVIDNDVLNVGDSAQAARGGTASAEFGASCGTDCQRIVVGSRAVDQ